MKRKLAASVFFGSMLAMTSAWPQVSTQDPADHDRSADVQLSLVFQGIAEGGISRSLRLFGGTGNCEAWYAITEVITAPPEMTIQSGDRLKLNYNCGKKRAYLPGQATPQPWAQEDGAFAHATLNSDDMTLDRTNTWEIPNPANIFAPVSVQIQQ